MNTNKKTWKIALLVGAGLIATMTLCGMVAFGAMAMGGGRAMMGRNQRFDQRFDQGYAPQPAAPVPPAQPGDDRVAPAPPVAPYGPRRIDRGGFDNGRGFRGAMRNQRGGFGGPFAIVGGILRFFFTLLLIGLAIWVIRRMFWGPRAWSRTGMGPGGRWGNEPPPWVEQWHAKMHAHTDTPASGDVDKTPEPPLETSDSAPKPETPTSPDDEKKDDNSPVI